MPSSPHPSSSSPQLAPPQSNPVSSPLRSSNKKSKSDHHTPPASTQLDLKNDLSREIRDHAWQFNSERIAKMLSADGNGLTDSSLLSSAQNRLKTKTAPKWPRSGGETAWYTPLETFLNNCIEACHHALRPSKSAAEVPRFYDRLKFIKYGNATVDGVDGAAPVRPDLVGGLDLESKDRVAWRSPKDSVVKQLLLPVEVKGDWCPMISQAATYARCLFRARPSRHFALALGFRHGEGEDKAMLRFLVFHRGGLTGSEPLSVKDERGQRDILRIFLSILAWKHSEDAGFPEFYNDSYNDSYDNSQMFLFRHKGDEDGVVATVEEVLHDGLCVRGRASRVLHMHYPTRKRKKEEPPIPPPAPTGRTRTRLKRTTATTQGGPHATPIHGSPCDDVTRPSTMTERWSSPLETETTNGDPAHVVVKLMWCEDKRQQVEAEILTACKDEFGTPDHHYSFCPTDTRKAPVSTARFLPTDGEQLEDFHWAVLPDSKVPSHPQRRSLWIHVSKLVGRSLVHAKTPWELYLAIGHAMLGWLAMLRRGFLHRDVSIGNTLMLDPPVVTRKPFQVRTIEELMERLALRYEGDLAEYAKLLEDVIKKMGDLEECHGFMIDGDMAAKLEGYFTLRDTGEASGTYEFMSNNLVKSLTNPKPLLHSPVDDLESFYYVAQWAAAFNDGAVGGLHGGIEIKEFRGMIAGNLRDRAVGDVRDLKPDTAEAEYGPFFAQSLHVLTPWREKLGSLINGWMRVMREADDLSETDAKEKYLGLKFLIYGYRGVTEFLELVHEHRGSLQV